jgi:Ser/Thr protein kinase RdoA (MazF antagonist)
VKTDINGSQAASKTGMSTPYLLRRYTEVWDGLIDAVEPEMPAGQDPRIHGRLENILVREMWMNSKLDDKILKKIW